MIKSIKITVLSALCALPFVVMANDNAFYDYRNGKYLQAEPKLAQLANNNDKVALFYYGNMYLHGYGKVKDISKGLTFIARSAEHGFLPAQMFLGKYYLDKMNDPEKAVYWFSKAADGNDVDAQVFVAAAYLYGYGVKRNPNKAKRHVIQAAKSGSAIAQYTLAEMFLATKHSRNKKLGVLWLKKSARQNNHQAEYELGRMYFQGEVVKKDLDEALMWLKKAAVKNVQAQAMLGKFYDAQGDVKLSMEWYQKAADANDSNAQFQLGLLYLRDSVFRDNKKAFMLVLKSAEQGNVQAQVALSKLYEQGIGVGKDDQLAQQWLEKSKKKIDEKKHKRDAKQLVMEWVVSGKYQGGLPKRYRLNGIFSQWQGADSLQEGGYKISPKAMFVQRKQIFKENFSLTSPKKVNISNYIKVIGELSYRDRKPHLYIPYYRFPKMKDYGPTFKKVKNRAEHGYAPSQFKLAQMYEYGLGVEKNLQQAIYWYEIAAEQHYMRAEYSVGLLYLEGNGVDKNYEKALHFFKRAAFRGDSYAQYILGLVHEYGLGNKENGNYIPKNIDLAVGMYNLASHNGYGRAKYNLAELYSSGILGSKQTVKEQQRYHKLILGLYEDASKRGVKEAQLSLAYYYAESSNPEKQRWAFNVATAHADKGNKYAKFLLALMYDRGIGVSVSTSKAISLYRTTAEGNNPVAQFILGTYYYLGEEVGRSQSRAVELLTKASAQNLPYANYNLAIIMHKQNNASEFLPLLKKAAKQNYIQASLLLADYYLLHAVDNKQLKDAADIYQDMADRGYKSAQLKLAYMYENGIFFNLNYAKAEEWYKKAALQNNVLAQYLLANLYQVGKLGEPNISEAKIWYKAAANQGFIPANVALGFLFEKFEHNYQQALVWYKNAADHGLPQAQFDLALMYQYGKGVKVDYEKAYEWYEKAAEKGYVPAQYAMGTLYLHGLGVSESGKHALRWYQKAADKGDRLAMYQLGLMYETGVGTSVDLQQAISYYQHAAEKGNVKAQLALARLYERDSDKVKAFKLYQQVAGHGNAFAQYKLGQMYQFGIGVKKDLGKAKSYYVSASVNGSWLATMQLANLSSDDQVKSIGISVFSYANPEVMRHVNADDSRSEERMYMNAINDLNEGKLQQSAALLMVIMREYPKFSQARKMYDDLVKEDMPVDGIASPDEKKPDAAAPAKDES